MRSAPRPGRRTDLRAKPGNRSTLAQPAEPDTRSLRRVYGKPFDDCRPSNVEISPVFTVEFVY